MLSRAVMVALLALGCVTARAAEPACVEGAWDQGVMDAAGWKYAELSGSEFQMAVTVAERDAGLTHGITAHVYSMARMVPGNSGESQFELAFLDADGCFRLRRATNHYDTFVSWFDDGSI
jgi:hypothetical protein